MDRSKEVQVNQRRVKALNDLAASYEAKRAAAMERMNKLNEELAALSRQESKEMDDLNAKFDAEYLAAKREADADEAKAARKG